MNHLTLETLNLYLDDQLAAHERASLESHLKGCAVCQQELAALRTTFAALDALPSEPIPIDLTAQVMSRIAPAPAYTPILNAVLLTQLVLITALLLWLAPILVEQIAFDLPAFDIANKLPNWLDDGIIGLQNIWVVWSQTPMPFEDRLSFWQWPLLIVVMGGIWLIGNQLILTTIRRETSQ